ncbi:hypothetical protein LTR84_006252 [Exophiala bonariae]|uniref:Uncharacterized protein n=1 Tax=Exophiala bonariae TaxID=1690606 RepID=A0AAV9N297_9EURO|nr:hypothetical protein LTR84_006252 [Exophiala bonariae]
MLLTVLTPTSNVPGDELPKSSMWSGDWIVVIEGLTFAWMRNFSINAAPPVVVTSTPTLTFTTPYIPSTTVTTTFTSGYTTTLLPSTITLPSTTSTRTITVKPMQVTVTSTLTQTRQRTTRVFSKTVTTTTITTSCKTQPPKRDRTCTLRPTRATLAAADVPVTVLPRIRRGEPDVLERVRQRGVSPRQEGESVKPGSGPGTYLNTLLPIAAANETKDLCTTTFLDTAKVVSSWITVTLPTSTELVSEYATTTATITPAPVTAYSDRARTTITITGPTPTRTRTTKVYTTERITSTVWATITSTVRTTPSGVVCATSRY